ncbi:germin-like protein subfamily 3 member 2 [Beta vulgaris subsp. vulgaris]|uniref:germin-like protein subfamily 3 member 2 n=1 Tax=Beta vulgaris subsp. vulgaris TaxID=3555 RepID=UPI002037609B|nr:germin-like protein subfamily 3 member 2 [Beta vulgaris subsp. vulgaris]
MPRKNMAKKQPLLFVMFFLYIFLANASDPDPVQDFCIPSNNSIPLRSTNSHFHFLPCKSLAEVTPEDFIFSGIKHPGNFSDIGFSGISVTPLNFPSLNTLGMSFARADLKIGGVNVPHLHPRATEIAYVVRGSVYSGFIDSTNKVFAKIIEAGEVMVYPRGLVHFQMNVGKSPATIIGSFNSQNPGIIRIPNALFGAGVNDELLEKAFGMTIEEISNIRKKFFPKKIT